ncbi:DUF2067 family protein [Pyrobaculum neutrophilum]|uniref:DUF2067 domain-containing protein n=1 Tax=Pyrobaculum neutrophilum (strain DSM 2338 / JCM 9278 / NBRC 100436 / V24Sta) TaxID=444157 RepID=B1YD93_PYRNV|nr:DUF2067 family protein [Pyrobaculum neutrophilum]ACB39756.1 conserved hypothetical protein [Pyrobaculum neutrophilum V24Sta]
MYLTLSFKFHSREEVERFLSFLERHLKTTYLVDTRLTHVYVQLEGEGRELEEAASLVKSLAALARGGRGRAKVPLLVVFKDAELARPVPPDALADALTLAGAPSEVRGGFLDTAASYEEVLKTAEALSRLYQEAEGYPLTPQAKKIAVVYAYVSGKPLGQALEDLQSAGLLNRGAVLSLRGPPDEARRRLRELLRRA